MLNRLIFAVLLVATLSGCAATAAAPTPKPSITAGQDAASIAAMIPGCKSVAAEDILNGGKTGLVSAASCTLGGHKVFVDSFTSTGDADLRPLVAAGTVGAYWAAGHTWVVILGDDPTMQEQITNDASSLLAQGFAGGAAATNQDAEKRMAAVVVKALGGTVVHIQP